MKKTLVAVALAIALPTLATASDLNPGALQLSGRSGFDFLSRTDKVTIGGTSIEADSSRLGASLSAMYFISKFLGFGLSTEYEKTSFGSGASEVTDSVFVFGPKAGLDYELMRHLSVFADGTVGVAQANYDGEKATGWGIELAAGVRLFLNPNVSLDLMGAFKRVGVDGDVTGKVTTTDLRGMIGFSLYLTNNPVNADYAR